MKAKINIEGNLEIERAGEFKTQYCPHELTCCGDKCPLFGEPEVKFDRRVFINGKDIQVFSATLKLCRATLTIENFVDERQSNE